MMQFRSPRTILAASAAVALTVAALAPGAAFAKGPGPGAGSCDGDCTAGQQETPQQNRARDGSGSGAQTGTQAGGGTQTRAKAGGGNQTTAKADGGAQTRANAGGGNQTKANAGGGTKVQARNASGTRQGAGTANKQQVRAGAAGIGTGSQTQRNRPDDRPLGPEACDECQAEMGELSDSQESELRFMAKEEKLAHEVYLALAELYDVPVFANIAEAEAQHKAAIDTLLERYGIEDETSALPAGEYDDDDLEALYLELVAKGSESLEAALEVGVFIEEDDIAALDGVIAALGDDAPDVAQVYANLLEGSKRHLEAFDRTA